jgi:(p)ppGpp synthase/HD superfamily hydrolase
MSDGAALERAIELACSAHRGQIYPSPEGEPFILHPLRVMLAVRGVGYDAYIDQVMQDRIARYERALRRLNPRAR